MINNNERECAEMYALGCISIEDVESILNCDVCDLTQEWHQYVKEYGEGYDKYIKHQSKAFDTLSSFNVFMSSRYGITTLATITGMTVDHAVDMLRDTFDIVCKHHMQYEVARDMANGSSFLDACRDWDLI